VRVKESISIITLENKVYNNALTNTAEGIEESDDSAGSNEIFNSKIEQMG